MADGYGFGAEGDWKAAALVRILKVMADGLPGGTSFMEDYTYHLGDPVPEVLGAHMLEVCPSIAGGRPSCEIHPLSIGGEADPVRLVFDAAPGSGASSSAWPTSAIASGSIASEVDIVEPDAPLPRLPVARAVWRPRPDLATGRRGVADRRRAAPHGADDGARAWRRSPDFADDRRRRAASRSTRTTTAPRSSASCAGTRPTTS